MPQISVFQYNRSFYLAASDFNEPKLDEQEFLNLLASSQESLNGHDSDLSLQHLSKDGFLIFFTATTLLVPSF